MSSTSFAGSIVDENNNRRIVTEFRKCINILRDLVDDDRDLLNGIDTVYEDAMIMEIRMVPEQFDRTILELFIIVNIFLVNTDFNAIADQIAETTHDIRLNFNTFDIFTRNIVHVDTSERNKQRMLNFLSKLKPLFRCFDALVYNPCELLRRVGRLNVNKYSDVL